MAPAGATGISCGSMLLKALIILQHFTSRWMCRHPLQYPHPPRRTTTRRRSHPSQERNCYPQCTSRAAASDDAPSPCEAGSRRRTPSHPRPRGWEGGVPTYATRPRVVVVVSSPRPPRSSSIVRSFAVYLKEPAGIAVPTPPAQVMPARGPRPRRRMRHDRKGHGGIEGDDVIIVVVVVVVVIVVVIVDLLPSIRARAPCRRPRVVVAPAPSSPPPPPSATPAPAPVVVLADATVHLGKRLLRSSIHSRTSSG